jgi:hypothetical protein
MEIEVPAAELVGIEQQMERLSELEGLQDDWKVQAEARDEVSASRKTSCWNHALILWRALCRLSGCFGQSDL